MEERDRKEMFMDKEMREMFNTVLEEMDRMEKRMEKRIDVRFDAVDRRFERLEDRMEQLHHEVNACKLERDSVGMLIKHMGNLEQEVDRHDIRITRLEQRLEQKKQKNLSMA